MPIVLTKQQYDELAAIDSATIANAIEPFKVRDDTTGFVGRDVTCLFPEMGVTLGYAVTATADSTVSRESRDRSVQERLWEAVEASPKPVVIVIQDAGPASARSHSCFCGDVMATIATSLGAIALVTDGGVRDLAEVREIGLQYFAGGIVVSHGSHQFHEINVPVNIDGMHVRPGDLIHADENGVVLIPDSIATKVADEARKVLEVEKARKEMARAPGFTAGMVRE